MGIGAAASACIPCPEGHSCTDPSQTPVACSKGYIAPLGSDNCTRCGYNEITNGAQTDCVPCPAGKACTDPTQDPTDCVSGEYALLGGGVCLSCPAGSRCPTTSTIEDCPPGTYSTGSTTDCTQCPAGHSCTNSSASQCEPGQYSPIGDVNCYSCSAGYYCTPLAGSQTACREGYYSEANATSCLECPPGYQCTSTVAQECTSGYYSLGQASSCSPCPAGFQCNVTNAAPVACNSGWYADAPLSTYCRQCDAGYSCADATQAPQPCDNGQYSQAGSTTCTDCPPGYACPDKTSAGKEECAPGWYATGKATECTPCTSGKYCTDTTSNSEIDCFPGTYSYTNATTCVSCQAGFECPNTDGSDMRACEAGEYSTSGSVACLVCPPGFACPSTDLDYQEPCVVGTYSTGQQAECSACPAGMYCPVPVDAVQRPCDDGSYSLGNASVCTACPLGYACHSKTEAPTSSELCAAGTFSLGGQTQCSQCNPGYYCPTIYGSEFPCPQGYYSGLNEVNCTICEAGYQCSDPTSPVVCPPGMWSPEGSLYCRECQAGYTCDEGSTSATPEADLCEPGGWCDGKDRYECPLGTYNPYNGSKTEKEACLACPPGFYCDTEGMSDYVSNQCPTGHYCPTGTTYATRFPCPGGTYNDRMNQSSEAIACITCPAGNYCPEGSSTDGTPCPAGFYCLAGQYSGFQNPCPLGTYGDDIGFENMTMCITCPAGAYCPFGSANSPTTSPILCEPGTYNGDEGAGHAYNCRLCDLGRSCPVPGLTNSSHPCAQGYYCPNGTITNDQYPCAPGTYTGSTSLTAPEECDPCWEGYYCDWATGETVNPPQPCRPGYYCPLQTPSPDRYPCLAGTFSPLSNLSRADQCTPCTPGYYCLGGEPTETDVCPPGFYCPEGTEYAEQYGCPNGTYNPHTQRVNVSQCQDCTQGHFCEYGAVNPVDCPAGTYMPDGVDVNGTLYGSPAQYQDNCLECTGGSYCTAQTVNPYPCGTSMFSKPGKSSCETCEAGYYCDNATTSYADMTTNKRCPAGLYCTTGLHSLSEATNCSTSHYCPEATPEELNCPVGTYNPTTGLGAITECTPCDAGFYCLEGVNTTNGPCDQGYYCPTNINNPYATTPSLIGSYGPQQVPCPAGTYFDSTGARFEADCIPCPYGEYCPLGSANGIICPRGYYCPENSTAPIPCIAGRYGNDTGAGALTDCPQCDPGWYCDAPGLQAPRAQCDPGFICYGGAYTSTPTDGVTGEICPAGGFCVTGSYESAPCPPGTFSNVSGAVDAQGCEDCLPGYYCSNARTPEPTGPCNPGFYCTGGATNPNQTVTQPGYYSPSGSTQPYPCAQGYYMPFDRAGECFICEAGYYCEDEAMTNMTTCPAGAYCPEGSIIYSLCPPGSYSNLTYQTHLDNCTICPPGSYCSERGAIRPSGLCAAGHICYSEGLYATPVYNNDSSDGQIIVTWGDQCLSGHYCPEGTTLMEECPPGTYLNYRGAESEADCVECNPGRYCESAGASDETADCFAGYYCLGGAIRGDPYDNVTGQVCPKLYHCPIGSSSPVICDEGTYSNQTGLEECRNCPVGMYCQPLNDPVPCPQGYYCLGGVNSANDPRPCQSGYFGDREGLQAEDECTECLAGSYCETDGLANVTGPIAAGFYSLRLAYQQGPFDVTTSTDYSICPRGYYCPEGSGYPTPCPKGSFGATEQLTAEGDCTVCTAGEYCPNTTMTSTAGQCEPGWYCYEGSTKSMPTDPLEGGECPTGYYCIAGADQPVACQAGRYNNETGRWSCRNCPAGFYCTQNTTVPEECDAGYYCPLLTATWNEHPCPEGTFNNLTGQQEEGDCILCLPGRYCEIPGLSWPTGECDAGWYCINGSQFSQPTEPSQGGRCPVGSFCPQGSVYPTSCSPGMYCDVEELGSPAGNCSAGHYCTGGAVVASPDGAASGDICPTGHYCPSGSSEPQECPPGTFLNTTQNEDLSDCISCTQGRYCSGYANSEPTADCDAGYYCPPGQNVSDPYEYRCPQGHYCPVGSPEAIRCPAGYYQDQEAQSDCKTCPAGFYCDNRLEPVVLYQNSTCPEGSYCPPGTRYQDEFKCPLGTYSNLTGLNESSQCSPCPGGFYCGEMGLTEATTPCFAGYYCRIYAQSSTPNQTTDANVCPVGYFCPEGTTEPQSCPPGTYSDTPQLEREDQCLNCTKGWFCGDYHLTEPTGLCYEGYYCPSGSSRPDQEECPVGHYCTNGTFDPTPCPRGRYSNDTMKAADTDCYLCSGGYYCETEGLTEPTGECGEGYYCPPGTIHREPNTTFCPVGHYCPGAVSYPIPCRNNTYVNYTHAVQCNPCPAGYHCKASGVQEICPAGYFCPEGTGYDLMSCPRGTYSPQEGLYDVGQCLPCSSGMYCDQEHLDAPTNDCSAGHFCAYGVDRSQPDGNNDTCPPSSNASCAYYDGHQTGYGGVCPIGFYCPIGTTLPIPCPNGTYASTEGQAECTTCQAGYYCPEGSTGYDTNPCPAGHYCPPGTTFAEQYQCPSGTFNNQTMSQNASACISCTAGYYCPSPALTWPVGECDGGYYCPGGDDTATPTTECTMGYYCPQSSSQPIPCPGGEYCADDRMSNTSGPCDAGYYCFSKATVSAPTDGNVTGDECPMGAYCPQGSASPSLCDAGFFLNSTRNDEEADCLSCIPGSYCAGSGNAVPTDQCWPGYYCPSGQREATPAEYNCTLGHYCLRGSPTPVRCPSGEYQDEVGQSECKDCPAGFFCDSTMEPVVLYNDSYCPKGFYCPLKTEYSSQFPCPQGTFNNLTHRTNEGDCQSCSGGFYCDQEGLEEPVAECAAGYYCRLGSNSSTPTFDTDNDECPVGHYCVQGSAQPQACPPGTYNPSTRREAVSECLNCTGGRYCPDYGMNTTGPLCQAGYYCESGADVATFQECYEGTFCPEGSPMPSLCSPGSWSDMRRLTAQSECYNCTAGYYCPRSGQTASDDLCWGGFYCPGGQDEPNPVEYQCPVGVHCPNGSAFYVSCPGGSFANYSGASECDICPEGFYCTPVTPSNASLNAQPCPPGYYCPSGTGMDWQPCPAGTYSAAEGLTRVGECLPCDGGQYCEGPHLTEPRGNCSAGYYCTSGVDRPDPGADNDTLVNSTCACPAQTYFTGEGGICPIGHYCPEGSSEPIPCEAGTYTSIPQQALCTVCPEGYYCLANATEFESTRCPMGHYCPNGTEHAYQFPCPPGTYQPQLNAESMDECLPCPGGKYCAGYGNSNYTAECDEGWYCTLSAYTPNGTDNGGECQPGFYCPMGSDAPIPCTPGYYCDIAGLATPTDMCAPGYYCSLGATSPTPTDGATGDECPAGFYCGEGSSYPSACPLGTYTPAQRNENITDCLDCTHGQYCGEHNLTAPSGNCSRGFYCTPGQQVADAAPCPVGYYCPEMTFDPILCPSGTYQTEEGQWTCDTCPPGYYCDKQFQEHPSFFCPEGTAEPYPCPAGTFSAAVGLHNTSECTPCLAGYYCESVNLTETEGPCQPGYYCPVGSSSRTEVICTRGDYCPVNSDVPTGCPEGTFNPYLGQDAVEDCTDCTPGSYCETQGLDAPTGPCEPSYYCPAGQNSSRPYEYPCTVSHYCPLNSTEPLLCENGTYMNQTHASECFICPEGWYCVLGNLIGPCPEGYYCPTGTGIDWQPCPRGTYNNETGLADILQCRQCPGGYYCGEMAQTDYITLCDPGHFCEYGVDRADPNGNNNSTLVNGSCAVLGEHTGVGGICPEGSYCPLGSDQPIQCLAGSYANTTGLATCWDCPEGYYCLTGAVTYEDTPCPEGHYCPVGTASEFENPCPAGTYFNTTHATERADCISCPGGYYCEMDGLGYPTGPCDPGWYCSGNSTSATTLIAGGECMPGTFCPVASYAPSDCTPGMYCQTAGLEEPTGNCSAGFYCTLGASDPAPTDNTTGSVCPVGHYCPVGSPAPLACPTGYYLNSQQNDAMEDCLPCPLGEFCPGVGREESAGQCDAGFYCPGGQNVSAPAEYICPVGYYCVEGSFEPQICENGTHQNEEGQSSCKECPAGYYCDNTISPVSLNYTGLCPPGHYCPAGTRYDVEFPCPIGTFNNQTGLTEESLCSPCLGGYYCPTPGMVYPQELCDVGFFCKQYANISAPSQGDDANECTPGHYCPEGTTDPVPCPKGSFSDQYGLQAEGDCQLCTPGHHCSQTGLTNTSGLCMEGFYCVLGSWDATNVSCPVGHYCQEGSATPEPCPAGMYSNTLERWNVSQCVDCDEGWYCNDTGLSAPSAQCDPGFYCPPGQSVPNPDDYPCSIGLHCPTGSPLPVPCEPGYFTNLTQAAECLECPAGFYCVPEEVIEGNSSAGHRECPQGYFCPAGTGRNWTACPPGTYGASMGLEYEEDCTNCPEMVMTEMETMKGGDGGDDDVEEDDENGGFYCDGVNLTEPTAECAAGYFCTSRVDRSNPTAFVNDGCTYAGNHTGYGGVCPLGYHCPQGSELPLGCAEGTYQDEEGQDSCKECPAGYYCLPNATTYLDTICPAGYYCPAGTTYDIRNPCPEGTFNNLTGGHNESWCAPCLPGMYCQGSGNPDPTDYCDPGWYCIGGAYEAQPTDPSLGGRCQAGEYCPQGASAPVTCDPGWYCHNASLDAPFAMCAAGYYCSGGSITGTPMGSGGDRCSPGHYCVEGSPSEVACPPGTYQPSQLARNITYCLDCLAGKYCNESGLAQPEGNCSAGFYCPGGQTIPTPNEYRCRPGYYCEEGVAEEHACPAGTYQDEPQRWDCKTCPASFYCDDTNGPIVNYTSYICPEGHYCPEGTRAATYYKCPVGTFNNITGISNQSECSDCLGGYYCGEPGLTYPRTLCAAGYYCRRASRSATPDQGNDADECPVGHYCPEGTTEPVACPLGTFSNNTGLMNVTECEYCTPGYYCDVTALTEPVAQCTMGFYCEQGSDNQEQYVCPAGRYCPVGTSVPFRCPAGTFSNDTRLSEEAECRNCTAGFYCQQTGLTEEEGPCTAGYYCPEGSSIPAPIECPIGLHCPLGSAEPKACASGSYTNRTTQSSCQICPQGFYCLPENETLGHPDLEAGYADCPAGYYCPTGTGLDWMPCPAGTYSDQTNLYMIEQCTDCPSGTFCPDAAATNVTNLCHEGYWCNSGVDRGTPHTPGNNETYNDTCPLLGGYTGVGGVCPRGHRCPEGVGLPIGCDEGTYQDNEGQGECKECPEGFFCPANSTDYQYNICPAGYYCPNGTEHGQQFPCWPGTYNNATGQTSNSSCLPCLGGMYCMGYHNEWPTSNCSDGWYCMSGASSPMPSDPSIGGRCQAGQYCPGGSELPTDCDPGMYCHRAGLALPQLECHPGERVGSREVQGDTIGVLE
ncbi:uncharacterized protein [Diadema antillarum]|uniref:uncharacterized protein n=1 Tax=Diadema antillarum TaxID=105358 RepID=UPI003A899AED